MASSIDPSNPTEGTATTKSVRDNFQAAKNEIEALQEALTGWQAAYPVGSIYINSTTADPNSFMGFGTWVSFAAGRVLVGLDTVNAKFDTLGETGGSETHTLSVDEIPSHTHTQDAHTHTQNSHNHTQNAHTHTQNSHNHTQDAHNHTQDAHNHGQDPHSHTFPLRTTTGSGAQISHSPGTISQTQTTSSVAATNQAATATNQATTATNQAATATNQNTTATNQAATATNQNTTATNQSTGGGGAHNNLQPYIVVNFWKRTA